MASVPEPGELARRQLAERHLALLELLRRFDGLRADLEQDGVQVGVPVLTIQMSVKLGRPAEGSRKKTS